MIKRRAPLLVLVALLSLALAAPAAHASRELLTEAALLTEEGKDPKPPPEGEIEGACGLAVTPSGSLYVSDYYHGLVNRFEPKGFPVEFGYHDQLSVPASPEGPCGLALDSAGDLYVNVWHQRVERISPTAQVIDADHVTAIAVDPATDYLYVDHDPPAGQSYVSVYDASGSSVENGGQPLRIGLGTLGDSYGIAVGGGRVYVADASTDQLKVYEPAADPLQPAFTIGGFVSLADAALAIDPTNGHLLVVDDTQPGYENPLAIVREFTAAGADLGGLPGKPVFGKPSGIAVDPVSGNLWVTDGNSEQSNVFAYGPYEEGVSPLSSPPSAESSAAAFKTTAATAALAPSPASRPPSVAKPHRHRPHRGHRRRVVRLHNQVKAGERR